MRIEVASDSLRFKAVPMDLDEESSTVMSTVIRLNRKKGIARPLEVVEECIANGLSEEAAKDAVDELLQSKKLELVNNGLMVTREFNE